MPLRSTQHTLMRFIFLLISVVHTSAFQAATHRLSTTSIPRRPPAEIEIVATLSPRGFLDEQGLIEHFREQHSTFLTQQIESPTAFSGFDADCHHQPQIPNNDNKQPKARTSPNFSTWKTRLNTKEDKGCIHKISNFAYVIATSAIYGTAIFTSCSEAPTFLGPFMHLFVLSTFVQGISSIDMAYKHRQGSEQEGFVMASFSSMATAFLALWMSPFANNAIIEPTFTNIFLIFLTAPGMIGEIKHLIEIPEILKVRGPIGPCEFFLDLVLPNIAAPPFTLLLISAMLHTINVPGGLHAQFMDYFGTVHIPYFYSMAIFSGTISYSALAVTLRDKKLITKEQQVLTVPLGVLLHIWAALPIFPVMGSIVIPNLITLPLIS